MEKYIGRVIEVFIPEEYKDGELIDSLYAKKIGFKVKTEDEVMTIVVAADEINGGIFKEDMVVVTKQNISGKEFIDIELYNE